MTKDFAYYKNDKDKKKYLGKNKPGVGGLPLAAAGGADFAAAVAAAAGGAATAAAGGAGAGAAGAVVFSPKSLAVRMHAAIFFSSVVQDEKSIPHLLDMHKSSNFDHRNHHSALTIPYSANESVICDSSSDEEEPEECMVIQNLVRVTKNYVLPMQHRRREQQQRQAHSHDLDEKKRMVQGVPIHSLRQVDKVQAPRPLLRQVEMTRLSHVLLTLRLIAAFEDVHNGKDGADGGEVAGRTPGRVTFHRYKHNLKHAKVHHWVSLVVSLHRELGSVAGLGGSLGKLEKYSNQLLSLLNVKMRVQMQDENHSLLKQTGSSSGSARLLSSSKSRFGGLELSSPSSPTLTTSAKREKMVFYSPNLPASGKGKMPAVSFSLFKRSTCFLCFLSRRIHLKIMR